MDDRVVLTALVAVLFGGLLYGWRSRQSERQAGLHLA